MLTTFAQYGEWFKEQESKKSVWRKFFEKIFKKA